MLFDEIDVEKKKINDLKKDISINSKTKLYYVEGFKKIVLNIIINSRIYVLKKIVILMD